MYSQKPSRESPDFQQISGTGLAYVIRYMNHLFRSFSVFGH